MGESQAARANREFLIPVLEVFGLSVFLSLLLLASLGQGPVEEFRFGTIHAGGNVYVLMPQDPRQTSKVVVSSGSDGVLLSDTTGGERAGDVRDAIDRLGGGIIRYVINTHSHSDHTGGNREYTSTARFIAHTNTLRNLVEAVGPVPEPPLRAEALPQLTFTDTLSVFFNGEEIRLIHLPDSHTDGDIAVFFTTSKVIHLGDVMLAAGTLPFTTDVDSLIISLDRLIALLPPDATVIPGHGPIATMDDLKAFRQVVGETRDFVRSRLAQGQVHADIIAAIPAEWTRWSSRYLSIEDWITELFVMLR